MRRKVESYIRLAAVLGGVFLLRRGRRKEQSQSAW